MNIIKMDIKQLKKELGLKNKDIAGFFDLSPGCYENSSAKNRYAHALCRFYVHVKQEEW